MKIRTKRHISRKSRILFSAILAPLVSFLPVLPGIDSLETLTTEASTTITWDGEGGDDNWSTSQNWSNNIVPGPGDIVTFNSTASKNAVIDDDLSVAGIVIEADYEAIVELRSGQRLTVGTHGFRQRGGTFRANSTPIDIFGSMILMAGSFIAPSSFLNIEGDLTILTNEFHHNNGTVVLNGVEQVVFGSANFHNFTKETKIPQVLKLQSGQTISTEGTLTLKGLRLGQLKLRASKLGEPFVLNPQGTVNVAYLDIKDSINVGLNRISCEVGCINSGNISGWDVLEENTEKPISTAISGMELPKIDPTDLHVIDMVSSLDDRAQDIISSIPLPTPSPAPTSQQLQNNIPKQPKAVTVGVGNTDTTDFAATEAVEFIIEIDTERSDEITITPLKKDLIDNKIKEAPHPNDEPHSWSEESSTPRLLNFNFFHWFLGHDEALAAPQPLLSNKTIKTEITNPDGVVIDIKPTIENREGQIIVSMPEPKNSLHPGKYRLKVEIDYNGQTSTVEQDFTWGVLTINFDQSTYKPSEETTIGMAVLDDLGRTICNARLTLDIQAPNGEITTITTPSLQNDSVSKSTITNSNTCGGTTITDNPDYFTTYIPEQLGEYQTVLVAETKNGARTIKSSFEVTNFAPFIVKRQSARQDENSPMAATRIYPPANYTIKTVIQANTNFVGQITETIPIGFKVSNLAARIRNQTGESVIPGPQSLIQEIDNNSKKIVWQGITLQAGDLLTLQYTYNAPDKSPQLYLLGPLSLQTQRNNPDDSEVTWSEPRPWQIAVDAARYWVGADTGSTANWNVAGNWASTSGGAGGAGVPTSADDVYFDGGNSKVGGVIIDADVDVASITATIDYAGGGAEDGHINNDTNDQSITVSGDVTLANAEVSMGTATTWTVSGSWDSSTTGTLNRNSSTLQMTGDTKTFTHQSSYSNRLNLTIADGASVTVDTSAQVATLSAVGTLAVASGVELEVFDGSSVSITGTLTGTSGTLQVIRTSVTTMSGTLDVGTFEFRPQTSGGGGSSLAAGTYSSSTVVFKTQSSGGEIDFLNDTYTFTGDVTFQLRGAGHTITVDNSANPDLVFQDNVTLDETNGTITWNAGSGTITLGDNPSDSTQAIDFAGKTVESITVNASGDTKQLTDNVTTGSLTVTAGTLALQGTISVTATAYSQSGGTFTGGSAAVDINGDFDLSGGVFTSTSGTMMISGDFTQTGSPTFDANGGTITFGGGTTLKSVNAPNLTFNLVTINKTAGNILFTIASGTTIPLGNSPTSVANLINSGTITAGTGTWTHAGKITNNGTINTSLSSLHINASGSQGSYLNNNATSSLSMAASPTLNIAASLTVTSGSTFPANASVTFDDSLTGTINAPDVTFSLVTINKISGILGITISNGTTIPLGNSPTSVANLTNNGTITAGTGTWTHTGDIINNDTITTSLSEIHVNVISVRGDFENNSSSTLAMSTRTFTLGGGLTVASDSTFPSTPTVTFDDQLNGSINAPNVTFNSITINKSSGGNVMTAAAALNINNNLTVTTGRLSANNQNITVAGNVDIGSSSYTKGTGTFTLGDTSGDGTQTIDFNGNSIEDLVINASGDTKQFTGGVTTGSFTATSGTVDFNGQNLISTGDFTMGTGSQIISDVDAMNEADIDIGGNLDLDGESTSSKLTINWTAAWSLDVTGNTDMDYISFTTSTTSGMTLTVVGTTATASYVDVEYSNASGGTEIDATDGTNTDNDNNSNWNFGGFSGTFTQNDWRWYIDNDNENVTDPWGNPDLSENTAITVIPASNSPPTSGSELRLRINITVGGGNLSADTQDFKLQYDQATDCATASGWTDIGAGGGGSIWRYATSSVADQTALSVTKLSTTDVLQAYAKVSPTDQNPNAVNSGQDMEWDFHIQHNGASDATTYCFRVIKSDDSALDAYNADSYGKLETKPGTGNLLYHGNVFVDSLEKGFTWAD